MSIKNQSFLNISTLYKYKNSVPSLQMSQSSEMHSSGLDLTVRYGAPGVIVDINEWDLGKRSKEDPAVAYSTIELDLGSKPEGHRPAAKRYLL